METQIYVNLPVKDLKRSTTFFEKLGFELNPKFSDIAASTAESVTAVVKIA